MEVWDLFDENRIKLQDKQIRGCEIPGGCYHIVVDVWTMNKKGEYLITQRHPSKKYGYLWECTGGSVLTGEDSVTGALRELEEEVGIRACEKELTLIHTIKLPERFVDTYITLQDVSIDDLVLQGEEVIDARFVNFKELNEMWTKGLVVPRERFGIYKAKLDDYRRKYGINTF